MNKNQLAMGLLVSIGSLTALIMLAYFLQAKTGELANSTFALIGWVSGILGMFVAGSSD